jgi:hypothetical protein
MVGYLVGAVLGVGVALFAAIAGFDRDRSFYPTVLIVVASYYGLFAIMGGSATALGWETVGLAAFGCLAVIGFRTSQWLVVLGLAGHGLFDNVHGHLIANPGIPAWWPAFCMSIDIVLAGCLAGLLLWRVRTIGGESGLPPLP